LETMRKALSELPDARRSDFRALVTSWRQGETSLQDLSDGLSAALRASSENEFCAKAIIELTHAGRIADAQMRLRRLGVVASAAAVSAVKAHLADYVQNSTDIVSRDLRLKNELPTNDDSLTREPEIKHNMALPRAVPCKEAVQNLQAAASGMAAPPDLSAPCDVAAPSGEAAPSGASPPSNSATSVAISFVEKKGTYGGDQHEGQQSATEKAEPSNLSSGIGRTRSVTSSTGYAFDLPSGAEADNFAVKGENLKAPVAEAASRQSTVQKGGILISGDC